MKGVVFNEFFSLVDEAFGPETTEAIVVDADLPNEGAYTGVGYYDAAEMVRLVKSLSSRTGVAIPELLNTFGKFLLGSFKSGHANYFASCSDVFSFVQSVEEQIHVDVLKLYPDAELPKLKAERISEHQMSLHYRSSRRMADLAEGLLWGAIDHYGDSVSIARTDQPDEEGEQCTHFMLTKQ